MVPALVYFLAISQWWMVTHLLTLQTSHIDWHLDAGLAIVFAEDAAEVAVHNPVSSKSFSFGLTVRTLIELHFRQLTGATSVQLTMLWPPTSYKSVGLKCAP